MCILFLKSYALNCHTKTCQLHGHSGSLRQLFLCLFVCFVLFAWQILISSSLCKDVSTKLNLPGPLCDGSVLPSPSVPALHLEKPPHRNQYDSFPSSNPSPWLYLQITDMWWSTSPWCIPSSSTSPFIPIFPAPAILPPMPAKHWIMSNMQIAGSAESHSLCSDYQSIYGSNKNWGCKILFPPPMIWYICSQWSGSQIEQIFIGARKWAVQLSNFQWWILEPIGSTECSDLCPLKQLLCAEQQTSSWNCLIFTIAKKIPFFHGPSWISMWKRRLHLELK